MSEVSFYLFAQQFALTGLQNIVVTDSAVTGATVSLNGGSTSEKHYRVFAAKTSSGAGTLANPYELLYRVETALNTARWRVRLQSNGHVRITYIGTGSGTLDITNCTTVALILGFDSSLGLSWSFPSQNSYLEALYLPTHAIQSIGFWPDSGWKRVPQKLVGRTLPDGTFSGWGNSRQNKRREGTISYLPRDYDYASAENAAGSYMFSDDTRLMNPSTNEPAQPAPWSMMDQMGNQTTQRWGCMFGHLQDAIAGADGSFDVCSVDAESIVAEDSNSPVMPGFDGRWTQRIALTWIASGER